MPAGNTGLATCISSCFGATIIMKENNFNFGETICLKSRAERQTQKRYKQ